MQRKFRELSEKFNRRLFWRFYSPPITRSLLKSKKKSDTLFILGSGASICSYSSEMWNHIRTHDSIGFNFWFLHEFVPDFYLGELPIQDDRRAIYFRNLFKVKENYSSCLKMFKSSFIPYYKEISKINGRIAFCKPIQAKSADELLIRLPDLLKKNNSSPRIYHQIASVDALIFFSVLLGYKEVVLCGVDLNNTEYFFEQQRQEVENRGLIIPSNIQTSNIHRTIDAAQHKGLLLNEVIDTYHRANLPNLANIYVALGSSALHPQLPSYQWPVTSLQVESNPILLN